ncbi:MAG: hypothetical protein LBC38_02530, partial [Oscillospiraceae bacterium]|nr:hypothetical protein [Oscillospiraceae bacterium]
SESASFRTTVFNELRSRSVKDILIACHALRKSIYLSIREISEKWTQPIRDLGVILGQLFFFFDGRLTSA